MSPVYRVAGVMFCKCSTVDIDISAGWLGFTLLVCRSAVSGIMVRSV